MRKIPLTKGKFALVDDEDYHYLSRFNWCFVNTKTGIYAMISIGRKSIYMQEIILPAKTNYYLKHLNNNTLDNRKSNFELISINHRRHLGLKKQLGHSKYRGVQIRCFWNDHLKRAQNKSKKRPYWVAAIRKDKITYFLGQFAYEDEKLAAEAYNKKAKELYGDFAYQNKIE